MNRKQVVFGSTGVCRCKSVHGRELVYGSCSLYIVSVVSEVVYGDMCVSIVLDVCGSIETCAIWIILASNPSCSH